jgi:integrase
MPVYKDENRGTWYAAFYYKDWTGENKKKMKRGFKTKKEAKDWERSFLEQKSETLDMTFADFVQLYTEDMKPKLRYNTWKSKEYIIQRKLIPYFGKRKMNEIKASDIIKWQNTLMMKKDKNGEPLYSRKYLKTIQSQLSCIFNHAVRLYELRKNPVHAAGPIGGAERTTEMQIWTPDQYRAFSEAVSDNVESFTAFEILYWGGLRLGEMLALTPADIDFEQDTIHVTKSLQHLEGQVIITPPKTKKGTRDVKIPQFLTREIEMLVKMQYGIMEDNRIFTITKSGLHHEMDRGAEAAGLDSIRIHDLRHSHISLLIEMGYSAVDIANRVGHENIDITMHYAHMFPQKQEKMAKSLEAANNWQEVV